MKLKKQINIKEGYSNTVYSPDRTIKDYKYLYIAAIGIAVGLILNIILKIAL